MASDVQKFPMKRLIGLQTFIKHYQNVLDEHRNTYNAKYVKAIVREAERSPDLMDGVTLENLADKRSAFASVLQILFPTALTDNEIKAAMVPFSNQVLRCTRRFDNIVRNSDPEFDLNLLESSSVDYEMLVYGLILQRLYNERIDFNIPLVVRIPNEKGPARTYRITYNADFIKVTLRNPSDKLTNEDIAELKKQPYNPELWRAMFPEGSHTVNGFGILTLTDITVDQAISKLKAEMLKRDTTRGLEGAVERYQVFGQILDIEDLKVGFTLYDAEEEVFQEFNYSNAKSFLLKDSHEKSVTKALDVKSRERLFEDQQPLIITDVGEYHETADNCFMTSNLIKAEMGSAVFYPIIHASSLIGILELVSERTYALNSFNITRLESVIDYIKVTLLSALKEYQDSIKALIQTECTSIHNSVKWRFEQEAKRILKTRKAGNRAEFRDVAFKNVFPLYGQIDIVGSSEARNAAMTKDFIHQLEEVGKILDSAKQVEQLPIYDQIHHRLEKLVLKLERGIDSTTEREIILILKEEVNPVMDHIKKIDTDLKNMVSKYEDLVESDSGIVYNHRYDYDHSVQIVNDVLSNYLDDSQQKAQLHFPHYFERFKTDGVEHNLYTGKSISHDRKYSQIFLFSLRLWQLKTMIEMEIKFNQLKPKLPMELEAASMILVFNDTLDIKYRIDERRFDVDGTYNARYEVIKKRIDKALIKGTEERLTTPANLSIIYSGDDVKSEYLRYLKYLLSKNYLKGDIEELELEEVQGVLGLKALRVPVNYSKKISSDEPEITFDDILRVEH